MIEELNIFFQALHDRYGKTGFVTEVTITNEASQFIPHISPKPGEVIELCFQIGRVGIRNGGDPVPQWIEEGNTAGGHPYGVRELDAPFKKGVVYLPSGQSVEVVWDTHGNVFHIDGWNNHREMFCIAKPDGSMACNVIPIHSPPPADMDLSAPAGEEKPPQPVRVIPHSLREVLNLPDPDEEKTDDQKFQEYMVSESEKEWKKEQGETTAGYHYMICGQSLDTGNRIGHVTLPNGETHAAEWDAAGNDTGGRRKFKIGAKDAS